MSKTKLMASLVIAAIVAVGCKGPALGPLGAPPQGVDAVGSGASRGILSDPHRLSGVVQFAGGATVQAAASDVVNAATLQFIDTATNMTIVTGIMTKGGSGNETFDLVIPLTFAPAIGQTFILEAVKGLGSNAPGNEAVRLRTIVQWTAGGWTSITGPAALAVTALTTAVALISGIDPANVSATQTIGTVNYAGGVSTFTGALTGHAGSEVNALTTSVKSFITGDSDPIGNLGTIQPKITGLSTTRVAVGEVVSVLGDGFSPVTGAATVSFNGTNATSYLVRSRNSMFVAVPNGATTGNVTVTTVRGTSNGYPIVVATPAVSPIFPVINSLSQSVVRRGDTLTLTGYNFNPTATDNAVTLNGNINLPITGGGTTQLTVSVPANAVSGPVTVSNANGTSGAFYLGVLTSGIQWVTEPFTDTASRDNVTTMDWAGTGSLNNPAALKWSQAGADFNALNGNNTVNNYGTGTYPKGGGAGMIRVVDPTGANFVQKEVRAQFGNGAHQAIASNGDIILTVDTSGGLWSYKIGVNNQQNQENVSQLLGYPFANEASVNTVAGIAGLPGSNVFYWASTGASMNVLHTLIINDYGFTRGPDIPLQTPINKQASTATYGLRLTSNGTYLYVYGGTAGGYASAFNIFKLALNGTAPITIAGVTSPALVYGTNSPYNVQNYYAIAVDDRAAFMPSYLSAIPAQYLTQWVNLTTGALGGANTTITGISASNNVMCYDAKNDCYWVVNGGTPTLYKLLLQGSPYTTTPNVSTVESPAIALPANQVWDKVSFTGVTPPNTTLRVDVLNNANGSVIYSLPAGSTGATLDLRNTPVRAFNGAVRLRAWLDTTDPNMTPYLTGWSISSAFGSQVIAQSKAYDTGVASGPLSYLSYTLDQPDGAPAVKIEFSASPDGVNAWSPWTTKLTDLRARYFRWRITPPAQTTYTGSIVTRVRVDYQR